MKKEQSDTNSTNSDILSAKQLQALPYIAVAASDTEGCEAAGISRNTYYKWMKEPAFKTELAKRRDHVVTEALDMLKGHSDKAVVALVGLLKTENEGLRRQTATNIIDYTMKIREINEIEKRLETIEEAIRHK